MKKGREWTTAYFCVACMAELSYSKKMYSFGRCPFCGHKGKHAGSVVDTHECPTRFVTTAPWWKFWASRGYWEHGSIHIIWRVS